MKKPEKISEELKKSEWPPFSSHPFVDEILFKTVYDQIEDDEEVISEVWGIRLNEKGELSSEYELLTLTTNHLLSVYSDLNDDTDKVHVFSQELSNVHKFSTQPSNLHKGYLRLNIVLKGIAWSLETNDIKTAEHFASQVDKLLLKVRNHEEDTLAANLLNDDKTNRSLKTVHADFLESKSEKTRRKNKKNFEAIKKYAKNNIIWYSIIIGCSFFLVGTAGTYLGFVDSDGSLNGSPVGSSIYLIYSLHRSSLVTAGIFALIFSLGNFASYVMLTMKIWDKEKFSRNFYRVIIQLILSFSQIIFSILLVATLNGHAFVSALYLLPVSFFLLVDAGYLLTKTYMDLKLAKKAK